MNGCPDWPNLVAEREAHVDVDAAWREALLHREHCGHCARESSLHDPLVLFQELPDLELPPDAVAEMQARVRGARRASVSSGLGRFPRRSLSSAVQKLVTGAVHGRWAAGWLLLALPLAAGLTVLGTAGRNSPPAVMTTAGSFTEVATLARLDEFLDRLPIITAGQDFSSNQASVAALGGMSERSQFGGDSAFDSSEAMQMQVSAASYDMVWLVGEGLDL